MAIDQDLYATPIDVTDIGECSFYHVMDLPGHGQVGGEWDLRGHEREYLGGVDFAGKRVLEVGPSSGFLTFYMDGQGADVVAFDLSPEHEFEMVPYAGSDWRAAQERVRTFMATMNKGWWFARQALGSDAKLAHGTVYKVPPELGQFDIATFNAVLLHLRDPFGALQSALALVTDTVVVTDVANTSPLRRLMRRVLNPHMSFLPNPATGEPTNGFWEVNPEIVVRMLGVLGFGRVEVTYHRQKYTLEDRIIQNFTVVGHRTVPIQDS
jgi:SAM-dependent methyltransferase